jgi:rRNA biogenesis protein RRP5
LALRSFREGDLVKAVIRAIDLDKKRISFSLKPSNFSSEDFESDQEEDESEWSGLGVIKGLEASGVEDGSVEEAEKDDEDEADDSADAQGPSEESDEESGDDGESMAVDVDTAVPAPFTATAPRLGPAPSLQLKGGFQWNGGDIGAEDDDDSFDESADDGAGESGKKKRKKRKQPELDLTADLQTKTPDSNADFERVLLGSPNSSFVWIQYMSFLLQLTDVDKAREIGRRAVKTISLREEQERLNIWIALLNLENVYGTDESIDASFRDAARYCDSKTVHLRMATIFEQSDKFEVRLRFSSA